MNVLYLTFYFEPDLCAGSFRNTPMVDELARQLSPTDRIHVVTTLPNRYQSFRVEADRREQRRVPKGAQIQIDRIAVPTHASGFADQIWSFKTYFQQARQLTRQRTYDLIVASSSRLFTAFLGAQLARQLGAPLFLDIRDLFRENILEVLRNPVLRLGLNPVLRAAERYTFGYARHINLVSEGFESYFQDFPEATYSFYTNGIDDAFLDFPATRARPSAVRTVLYAGNIGEGQGLHKVIPEAARRLATTFRFEVIGDGGAKQRLLRAVADLPNVVVRPPVSRAQLLLDYERADYLLVHLNDLRAFERVLPSKLFEYAATDKPILAGVSGYAHAFLSRYVDNCLLFAPGDASALGQLLQQTPYRTQARPAFVAQFGRRTIARQMARQMLAVAQQAD